MPANVEEKIPTSKTAMLEAIKRLDAPAMFAGLDAKPALIEYRDDSSRNWLHIVCSIDRARRKGNPDAVVDMARGLISEYGFKVNEPSFTEGAWQATPLWYAVARGENLKLAKYLLDSGSSPAHCLWAAAFREDEAMLKLLIERGAPLEDVAEDETPLFGAVKYSKFKAARLLLEAGASPDYVDSRGRTALHCMLKKNSDLRHYRMFAEHGARGDIPDRTGKTADGIMRRKRDKRFHAIADQLAQA